MKRYFVLLMFMILPLNFTYADNIIPITLSSGMEQIQFDGKWSNELEWKPTSLYELHTNNGTIYLRAAHQDDFIYLMIDVIPDTEILPGKDSATVCFDTQNDKTKSPDTNDYCFVSTLGETNEIILKGNSASVYSEIKNTFGFISVGTVSDNNDRYSKIHHASYELKIPTELVGRSDNYGFFFLVNDEENNQYFWPSNSNNPVNSPDKWGNLVSPDKSLPEFETMWIVLIFGITITLILTRNKLNGIYHK